MKRITITLLLVLATAVACFAQTGGGDLKLKIRTGTGEPSATYIKGSRQRMENPGGAMLMQCDLKRMVMLMPASKTYMVMPFGEDGAPDMSAMGATPPAASEPARRGGIVTHTTTITDTGERQQMFGYTARRIKTKMTSESSPEACEQDKTRVETDGWYIDLQYGFYCATDRPAAPRRPEHRRQGCIDDHRFKQTGTARLGFPLKVTTTVYDEQGKPNVMTMEVLELSRATLDQSLFEIPSGYTEMKSMRDLAAAMASGGQRDAGVTEDGVPAGGTTNDTSSPTGTGAPALAPKNPGVIRIGVPLPNATAGEGMSQANLAAALRSALVQAMTSGGVEAVPLEASAPSLLEAELKQKEIDFVLYATATHKKGGGGGFGGFMRKAAPVIGGVVPMGGGDTTTTNGGGTSATLASSIKNKDELTLAYELQTPGNASPVTMKTLKGKARSDGEDVLTPLVRQAVADILAAAVRP